LKRLARSLIRSPGELVAYRLLAGVFVELRTNRTTLNELSR
jgi:hypothetical protein